MGADTFMIKATNHNHLANLGMILYNNNPLVRDTPIKIIVQFCVPSEATLLVSEQLRF
jgi:hypothetical protein